MTRGSVQATVAAAPSAVQAILVTVTAQDIQGDVRTLLTKDGTGHWSGTVLDVPAGIADRTVTAYAYSSVSVPADPAGDDTGLIFLGATPGVSVTAAEVSHITVVLHPYPADPGGTGINTPPHLTALAHPDWIASSATASLSATAVDPDDNTVLTYSWDDNGAGGVFSGGGGQVATNQLSGNPVAVDYTPAAGFLGQVQISLAVQDGTATVHASFKVAVGSGVTPVLEFDVLPEIQILQAASQEFLQGEGTTIDWQLAYPAGAGPDAAPQIDVDAFWSDSCGGTFDVPDRGLTVDAINPPVLQQVVYHAPPMGSASSGWCELRLTVRDVVHDASEWSSVMAWVSPVANVGGWWIGTVADAKFPGGQYQLDLQLSQVSNVLSGTYSNSLAEAGDVAGTVADHTATFTVTVTSPGCEGTLDGTGLLSGDGRELSISYTGATACQGVLSGSGILTLRQKVVFVTAATHNANFGGRAGADAFCQAAADAASGANKAPAGTYRAFLSVAGSDAATRLQENFTYVLPDGTLVAASKADFLDGTLAHAINMNQNGVGNVNATVWTGSAADGTRDTHWNQCNDWTKGTYGATTDVAIAGYSSVTDATWVFKNGAGSNGWWCSDSLRLYCVQQ